MPVTNKKKRSVDIFRREIAGDQISGVTFSEIGKKKDPGGPF
jgi:hypothetical protein